MERQDLRRKVREHRSPFSVVFVVDNSYSVQAEGMVETVKGLTFRLLEDATHRGDKVALVAFNGGLPEATVALPLTTSLPLARRRLREIPLSGRTPLADGLRRARRVLKQESVKHPNAVPVVVVVTDGLPTVPLHPGGSPLDDALSEARRLKRSGILVIVADSTPPDATHPSCGPQLALAGAGVHLPIGELAPDAFGDLLERLA